MCGCDSQAKLALSCAVVRLAGVGLAATSSCRACGAPLSTLTLLGRSTFQGSDPPFGAMGLPVVRTQPHLLVCGYGATASR